MTVKKLSKKKEEKQKSQNFSNSAIDQFIGGGGKTTAESSEIEKTKETRFTLRIPSDFIEKIDLKRKQEVGNQSRNTWILQAIAEKLSQS